MVRTEFSAERYAVLKAARPDLAAELFEVVETKANEIAIVSLALLNKLVRPRPAETA